MTSNYDFKTGEYMPEPAEPREESLASVAPRVINLAMEVDKATAVLEQCFGIQVPSKDGSGSILAGERPNLMHQLMQVEYILRNAMRSLENIHRHVNG